MLIVEGEISGYREYSTESNTGSFEFFNPFGAVGLGLVEYALLPVNSE